MAQEQGDPGADVRVRGKQRRNPTPKAGRNLPAATAVGVGMLIVVLGGLLFLPLGFVLIVTTFAVFGVWEVFRALETSGTRLPIIPVMTGTVAMPAAAYFGGPESLLFAMMLSSVAVLIWRSLEGAAGSARQLPYTSRPSLAKSTVPSAQISCASWLTRCRPFSRAFDAAARVPTPGREAGRCFARRRARAHRSEDAGLRAMKGLGHLAISSPKLET